MTNEELDDAVALEAVRICEGGKPMGLRFRELAQTAARLAREGWTPPPPVDPDVLAVRVVLADQATNRIARQAYLNGAHDAQTHFQSALAAFKAGRAAR
jgi:hypothetical protein